MIELNFSCPNVETGLIMGADPGETARVGRARCRPLTDKPLIVKLTPNATDPAAVAAAAEEAGRRRRVADQHAARAWRSTRAGPAAVAGGGTGRSVRSGGPGDRPGAGRARRAAPSRIPVIGMGGIASGRDARRFPRRRGASASRSAPKASATRPRAAGSRELAADSRAVIPAQ